MNIFVLDNDPVRAAREQCDKHIVKMPLETAQMLCTAVIEHGGSAPYRATHKNHPCTVWARESIHNFLWLYQHGEALCEEYTRRYGRKHKCLAVIRECFKSASLLPIAGELTPLPLCMPDKYKTASIVDSYRSYYIGEKSRFAKWKLGNTPDWWPHE